MKGFNHAQSCYFKPEIKRSGTDLVKFKALYKTSARWLHFSWCVQLQLDSTTLCTHSDQSIISLQKIQRLVSFFFCFFVFPLIFFFIFIFWKLASCLKYQFTQETKQTNKHKMNRLSLMVCIHPYNFGFTLWAFRQISNTMTFRCVYNFVYETTIRKTRQ